MVHEKDPFCRNHNFSKSISWERSLFGHLLTKQSGPESGTGFQVKQLETFELFPCERESVCERVNARARERESE